MTEELVVSTDGAVSGHRAACAAVVTLNGRVIREKASSLRGPDGYVLAAEIAAVALAGRLVGPILTEGEAVTLEVDNPYLPRVLEGSYRPPGFDRIPSKALLAARAFCERYRVTVRVLPRNSTPGLRQADHLAGQRLWARRHVRRPGP